MCSKFKISLALLWLFWVIIRGYTMQEGALISLILPDFKSSFTVQVNKVLVLKGWMIILGKKIEAEGK